MERSETAKVQAELPWESQPPSEPGSHLLLSESTPKKAAVVVSLLEGSPALPAPHSQDPSSLQTPSTPPRTGRGAEASGSGSAALRDRSARSARRLREIVSSPERLEAARASEIRAREQPRQSNATAVILPLTPRRPKEDEKFIAAQERRQAKAKAKAEEQGVSEEEDKLTPEQQQEAQEIDDAVQVARAMAAVRSAQRRVDDSGRGGGAATGASAVSGVPAAPPASLALVNGSTPGAGASQMPTSEAPAAPARPARPAPPTLPTWLS